MSKLQSILFFFAFFFFTFLFCALTTHEVKAQQSSIQPIPDKKSPLLSQKQSPVRMSIPSGWDLDPELSLLLQEESRLTNYWNKKPTTGGVLGYKQKKQGVIYLSWIKGEQAELAPEQAIRTAFDNLHESPFLANTEPGDVQELEYRESNAGGQIQLYFEWSHLKNNTLNIVRSIAWKDSKNTVHLVIAECILNKETVTASKPHCEKSLASLTLTSHIDSVPLRALEKPAFHSTITAEDIQIPKLKTGTVPPSDTLGPAPQQRGKVVYQGATPEKSASSNRIFIGIGILLLGLAIWLTSRDTKKNK